MNTIILALAALSNLTGVGSSVEYPTNFEHYVDAATENEISINSDVSDILDVNEDISDIYDLTGVNRYLDISFSNGKCYLKK